VAGECGDDKREIVYFGDTINTAARMQEKCRSVAADGITAELFCCQFGKGKAARTQKADRTF
jgi:class 3 adenylate cyclase